MTSSTASDRYELSEADSNRLIRRSELALALNRTIGGLMSAKNPNFGKLTTTDVVSVLAHMMAEVTDRLSKEVK